MSNLTALLNPANIFGSIVTAISAYFLKKKEKQILETQAKAKIEVAKAAGETQIALKDAEWEAISVGKSDSTWKDEYVTLVVTWPLIGILGGSLWKAFSGNDTLLIGTLDGIRELTNLGMDFGLLMTIVVSAAVSIKVADKMRRL
jgi:hypothetical protein